MYVLDSNTFIDAKNRYYGFDIVPSFWNELISHSRGNILTIDHIKNEIMSGNDELSIWFDTHYLRFTEVTNDVEIQNTYADIAEYVMLNQQYKDAEKHRFLAKADPWLIAYASVHRGVVVTHEVLAGPKTTKVKIPDICEYFDVSYVNVFEMMRQLHMVI